MTDVLDRHVPRSIIAMIMPESIVPRLEIAPLGEGRVIGSLRRIPKDEVSIHEMRVLDYDYKWTTFLTEELAYIVFFDEPDENVREALLLEQRDIGLMEPPLSINEHMQLATAYGVSELVQENFMERALQELREHDEGRMSKEEAQQAVSEMVSEQSVDYKDYEFLDPQHITDFIREWEAEKLGDDIVGAVNSFMVYLETNSEDEFIYAIKEYMRDDPDAVAKLDAYASGEDNTEGNDE